MHSPTKNQQMTSVVTRVLRQASLTVIFCQLGFLNNWIPSRTPLINSIGVGGLISVNTASLTWGNLMRALVTTNCVAALMDAIAALWDLTNNNNLISEG